MGARKLFEKKCENPVEEAISNSNLVPTTISIAMPAKHDENGTPTDCEGALWRGGPQQQQQQQQGDSPKNCVVQR